jgi:hypothetical protein
MNRGFQAMFNDRERRAQEQIDIERLMAEKLKARFDIAQ